MSVTIRPNDLGELAKFFEQLPDKANSAMSLAINQVARRDALKGFREAIYTQIAFPRGYLDERLKVSQFANPRQLRAVISGRDRPTSLARFASGQIPVSGRSKNPGVLVKVRPGTSRLMPKAWLMTLRNGNIGLAVRLKEGQSLPNKRDMSSAVSIGNGVYLLYGPSVDQAFELVGQDQAPDVARAVENEFIRQFGSR